MFAVDRNTKHDGVVVEPFVATRDIGGDRVVCGRDAVAAVVGPAEWAVIDQHPAPLNQSPIDIGAVFEERLPPGLHGQVGDAFIREVVRGCGNVPTDEQVRGESPRAKRVDFDAQEFLLGRDQPG